MNTQQWIKCSERMPATADYPVWQADPHCGTSRVLVHCAEQLTHTHWLPADIPAPPPPEPKIAPGHNPDKLTEEQVGVSEGWRLLEKAEIHADNPEELSLWRNHGWTERSFGILAGSTYRTKRPPGWFLPEKVQEREDEAAFQKAHTQYMLDPNVRPLYNLFMAGVRHGRGGKAT